MVNKIIEYINSQGRFSSSNELIENSIWYVFSSYISIINPTIEYKGKNIPINYFGISIARSGSGKSFIYNKVKELFNISKWNKALEISFDNANRELPNDDIYIEGEKYNVKNFLPNFENSIEGSKEGLYLRCLAQSKCFAGSVNLVSEEIMDIVINSNLNTMKELYDGNFLGKVIKGNINKNIYGIKSNMLLFGSSTGLKNDNKIYSYFQKALNSGIYRRSFIYYEEPKELNLNHSEPMEIVDMEYIYQMIRDNMNAFIKGFPTIITIDKRTMQLLEDINQELIEFSNQYLDDERFSAEIGSFDKILKLSGLYALLHNRYTIEEDDVVYAYNMYKRLRETNKTLFNIEPQHKRIYKIIKRIGRCTKTDILEKDIFNRLSFNEDISLVDEYCYKNNEQLAITGSKIKFYEIKELDKNNLQKIIISVPSTDRKERTTQYNSMTLPMFGEASIEKVLIACKISNFCLVHFEKGKRSKNNSIPKINCIGIDVDYGSLEETKNKLDKENLIYLIYTTRNHQKEKNGIISDRFRILLPLSVMVEIEPERYSKFIENICLSLGITVYDTSALDMSRLWFTSKECLIYTNTKGELFRPIAFLPDTSIDEEINNIVEKVEITEDDEVNRRINGFIRWTIANTGSGNRNNNLARLGLFVYDLTHDKELAQSVVLSTNNILTEPLSIKELEKTIFKTLRRK